MVYIAPKGVKEHFAFKTYSKKSKRITTKLRQEENNEDRISAVLLNEAVPSKYANLMYPFSVA